MEYDDFKILKDEEYFLLQEQYNRQNKTPRTELVSNIFTNLNTLKALCLNTTEMNFDIQECLNTSFSTFNKLISNLKTNFNLEQKSTYSKNFNIFNFLDIIVATIKEYDTWQHNETKTFYVNLIFKDKKDLLEILTNLLCVLKNKYIKIFKFM